MKLNHKNSIVNTTLALTMSWMATAQAFEVPVMSMYRSYKSEFGPNNKIQFQSTMTRILEQLGCSVNVSEGQPNGILPVTDYVNLNIEAGCPHQYPISFQTLTNEMVFSGNQYLFLNGRLVQFGDKKGEMRFSDGELITPYNIGNTKDGYKSHPSKLDPKHAGDMAMLRKAIQDKGQEVGIKMAAGGVALKIVADACISYLGYFTTGTEVLTAAGMGLAALGAGAALMLFPTSSQANDLDSKYRGEEYRVQLENSDQATYLKEVVSSKDYDKIAQGYRKGLSAKELVEKYGQKEAIRELAIINYYNWWQINKVQ